MIFKTIPQNGASWLNPLLYSLDFGGKREQVAVEIFDQLTNTQLGRVVLYNIASAELDIAPYIRNHKIEEPLARQSSVIERSQDVCKVVLRVEGVESESRLFFRSDISDQSPGLMSTIIENGTIAVGEVIRFTLWAQESVNIITVQPSDDGFMQYDYNTEGMPCEVVLPIKVANVGDVVSLRVVCDNQFIGLCKYRVVERDSSAVRLAWVNAKGGVECHTFPQSIRRSLVVKSEDLEGECGWYRRIVSSTVVRRLMMMGATLSEVDRMLDILLSPKVYRCDSEVNMAVQLLTDSISYDDHGKLHRLEFDIKEEWKGGAL